MAWLHLQPNGQGEGPTAASPPRSCHICDLTLPQRVFSTISKWICLSILLAVHEFTHHRRSEGIGSDHTRQMKQGWLDRREAVCLLGIGLSSFAMEWPLVGCGPVGTPRIAPVGTGSPQLQPLLDRIDAIPGEPLVFPVNIVGPMPTEHQLAITLADKRTIDSSLIWIGIRTELIASAEASTPSWLPQLGQWVVSPASAGAIPASVGAWYVRCHMPVDARGREIQLGRNRIAINWLNPPAALVPRTLNPNDIWEPWSKPRQVASPDVTLLEPEWKNPLRLWRARLCTVGLATPDPSHNNLVPGTARGLWEVQGDRQILDDMAAMVEARWRVGLARHWFASKEQSQALRTLLLATAKLGNHTIAPIWPIKQDDLDSLLDILLSPELTDNAMIEQVALWMDSQHRLFIWVEDDASDASSLSLPAKRTTVDAASHTPFSATIAAALRSDRPELLWIADSAGRRVGDPHTIEPGDAVRLRVDQSVGHTEIQGSRLTLFHGGRKQHVLVRPMMRVKPPGAQLGPLRADATLASWATHEEDASNPSPSSFEARFACVGLLLADDSGHSPSGWSLYLECAFPKDAKLLPEDDQVQLFFGSATTKPASESLLRTSQVLVRVDATGRMVVVDQHDEHDSPQTQTLQLPVARSNDRWSVTIPIPALAIESELWLRLGIVRRVAGFGRFAWPEPMLPWQQSPARAAFRLDSWHGPG